MSSTRRATSARVRRSRTRREAMPAASSHEGERLSDPQRAIHGVARQIATRERVRRVGSEQGDRGRGRRDDADLQPPANRRGRDDPHDGQHAEAGDPRDGGARPARPSASTASAEPDASSGFAGQSAQPCACGSKKAAEAIPRTPSVAPRQGPPAPGRRGRAAARRAPAAPRRRAAPATSRTRRAPARTAGPASGELHSAASQAPSPRRRAARTPAARRAAPRPTGSAAATTSNASPGAPRARARARPARPPRSRRRTRRTATAPRITRAAPRSACRLGQAASGSSASSRVPPRRALHVEPAAERLDAIGEPAEPGPSSRVRAAGTVIVDPHREADPRRRRRRSARPRPRVLRDVGEPLRADEVRRGLLRPAEAILWDVEQTSSAD